MPIRMISAEGSLQRLAAPLLLLALLAACGSPEKKEAEPVAPVRVAPVKVESIRRIITADAILYPRAQSAVTPKISAPVKTFYVNRGDRVKKGQLLAVLENSDLRAAVEEGRGNLAQAEAAYATATGATVPEEVTKAQQDATSAKQAMDASKAVLDSRQALLEQRAIARRLVDEARVAYVQARSTYEVAQEHLKAVQNVSRQQDIRNAQGSLTAARGRFQAAQANLAYSEIRSPIDGVVADRGVYPGEMASAGSPLITIMQIDRIVARANVPAPQASLLKVGDAATLRTDTGVSLPAAVTVVSPATDPSTTTVQVWAEADNAGDRLHPGTTVHVDMVAETIPNAVVVPQAALLPGEAGGNIVLVAGPGDVAHQHTVETGVRENDRVQIVSGVRPGEQVIVSGGLGLQDGAKIRIAGEGAPKETAADEK